MNSVGTGNVWKIPVLENPQCLTFVLFGQDAHVFMVNSQRKTFGGLIPAPAGGVKGSNVANVVNTLTPMDRPICVKNRGGTSYEKVGGQKIQAQSARKTFARRTSPTIPVCPPTHRWLSQGAHAPNEEVGRTMQFGPPTLTPVDRNNTIFRLH